MSTDGFARLPAASPTQIDLLLVRRARAGLGLALVSIALFAIADFELRPQQLFSLYLLKLIQAGVVGVTLALLTRREVRARPVPFLLLGIGAICLTTAASGVLTHDFVTTSLLFIIVTLVSATLLPWGPWPQAVTVVIAAVALGWDALAAGGVLALIAYPVMAAVVAFVASIYLAHAFEEARLAIEHRDVALHGAEALAHLGSWHWDVKTNTVTWSAELYRIFGLAPSAFGATFEGFLERVHPDDRQRVADTVRVALERAKPFDLELRIVRPDGAIRTIRSQGEVIVASGMPARMIGSALDITDQKTAERALRESEQRFRTVFAMSPEAMTLSQLADGKLIDVNDAFVRLSEFSREETIGRRSIDLGLWRNPGDWAEGIAELRAQGSLSNVETDFRNRSGKVVTALASVALVPIGAEPCVVTSIRDVSEQKLVERMRHDVVRMLSHDIKNPLASIMGFAGILREDLREGRGPGEAIDFIESSAQQATHLAMNFLDADRIESGALELRKKPTSLNDVVEHVLRHQAARARVHQVALHSRLFAGLPAVELDEALIDRAVANLVVNAIKFSPKGEAIVAATGQRDGCVLVAIHDRGPGIAPRDAAKLFHRYRRGAGSRTDSTGLGLFIVKTIVEAHGGTVEVRCPSQGGSVFEISLPVGER